MTRRHASRVVQVVERAAAAEALVAALVVQLHRQTDDVMTLLGEQGRGDGRIHAARHGDDDAHVMQNAEFKMQKESAPTWGRLHSAF